MIIKRIAKIGQYRRRKKRREKRIGKYPKEGQKRTYLPMPMPSAVAATIILKSLISS